MTHQPSSPQNKINLDCFDHCDYVDEFSEQDGNQSEDQQARQIKTRKIQPKFGNHL